MEMADVMPSPACFGSSQTFMDVQTFSPRPGPVPKRVILSVPHTNEIPAVRPFISEFMRQCEANSILVSAVYCNDNMRNGWKLRQALESKSWGRLFEPEEIGIVLNLLDLKWRFQSIIGARPHPDGSSQLFEIHATNSSDWNATFPADRWQRFGNTGIVLSKYPPGYIYRRFLSLVKKWPMEKYCQISSLLGFNFESALAGLAETYANAKPLLASTGIIEVPSGEKRLPEGNRMHWHYYTIKEFLKDSLSDRESSFESSYCAGIRTPGMYEPSEAAEVFYQLYPSLKKEG